MQVERGEGKNRDLATPATKRWRDGSTAVVLGPLELLERLCALVPPPQARIQSPPRRRMQLMWWLNTRRSNSAHEYLDRGILTFLGACGTFCPAFAATPPCSSADLTSTRLRCRQPSPSAPTAGTTCGRQLAAGANTPWYVSNFFLGGGTSAVRPQPQTRTFGGADERNGFYGFRPARSL